MFKLLRNVNIVDVDNENIIEKANILIDRNKIAQMSMDEINIKDNCQVYDYDGCYVLPGLIDMHTHLIWSGGDDPVRTVEEEGLQLSLLHSVYNANKTLKAGITTVREVGSNENASISLGKAIERGYVVGPRIISCGCSIIMTGGHDPFWGLEADGVNEVIKAVRKQVLAGAKVIKVSATGGVYGKIEGEDVGTSEFTFEELKAIADEAHRFGLKVAAHVISEKAIWDCINAGIDTLEHAHFLTEDAMDKMIEKGIYWVPTLYTYRQIAKGDNVPAYASEKAKAIVDIHREAFIKGLKKNVPIAAGSDAGSPAGVDHPSLLGELESMAEYGCSTIKAIKSATLNAAKALNMEKFIGSLEVGKFADIVVVSNNPLENISNLKDIVKVFIEGCEV